MDEDNRGKIYDARLMRRLLKYVRPYLGLALAGLFFVMATVGLVLLGPLIIRAIIDGGINRNPGTLEALSAYGITGDVISVLAFLFLGAEILRFVAEYMQGYLLQKLGQRSMRDLRLELFRHMQTLPLSFYEQHRVGRLVTHTTNDIGSLSELFSTGLVTLFKDVILIVAIAAVLLQTDFVFGLITLSVAPLLVVVTWWFRRTLRSAYRRVRAAIGKLNATMQENIGGVRVIQLFGIEEDRHRRFQEDNKEFMEATLDSVRSHAIFAPFISLSTSLSLALIFWYGGGAVIQNAITLGTLVLFIKFTPHLMNPIRDLGEKFTILQSAFAASERIFQILDAPPGIVDKPDLKPFSNPRGDLTMDDVRFGYQPEREILHGLTLDIPAGQRVAIVGKTGAGKSTLSKLLVRYYDPSSGAIRLDGRDLRDVPLKDLHSAVAMVTQDIFIFPGSILDNIRLGDESIPREAVIEACRWTNAHTFIEKMPGTYDAMLVEGGRNLSLGERQLLSFARALVRRPAVLILDEATASVDTRTERLIGQALDRITRGRTSIIIAHRLATVQNADRVVVIDHGRVVEDGPPSKLMSGGGIFQTMHALQFKS
jgi:ATP-binding cassette subfamily B protein